MGIFSFLRRPGIDEGVEECRSTQGAMLIDVRTREEYAYGHIPGSKNLPLQQIDNIGNLVSDKNTPIFVYCHSGSRSGRAEFILKGMGYTRVTNIGGIASYRGKVEI